MKLGVIGMIIGLTGGIIALLVGIIIASIGGTLGGAAANLGQSGAATKTVLLVVMSILVPVVSIVGAGLIYKQPNVSSLLMKGAAAIMVALGIFGQSWFIAILGAAIGAGSFIAGLETRQSNAQDS